MIEDEKDFFGVLYPFIRDDRITDIDYNGRMLWLTDCDNRRWREPLEITPAFLEQFSQRVSNTVSRPFNKQSPVLEAETKTLRITIVHESVALSGRCVCIRKSLPYVRLNEKKMLREKFCTPEILELLKQCVKERKNIVFCGQPGVGKTECAKFFSGFISPKERVITIEDTPEWHFKELHPQNDAVELRINDQMDYTGAIRTCLRLNPSWIMLSETRSSEVVYLIEGFSTGVRGITTLHTDDVRKIPDRMLNMAGNRRDARRFENDIYSFLDVGVLLSCREVREPDGTVAIRRYIDQICFISREDGINYLDLVADEGILSAERLKEARRRNRREEK